MPPTGVISVALDCAVPKDRVGFDPLAGTVLAPTTRTMPSKKTARFGDEGKAADFLVWVGGFAL
jgi:hypothetical protein